MPDVTRLIPPQLRQARLLPSTFDAENRTVEVSWTTGAAVRRYDFWNDEYYMEELSLEGDACDLSRLTSGNAAVLDSHNRWSLNGQIGVVERAWIENGEGRAVLRLSNRNDIAGVVQDIVHGIIRNISVGYTVQRYVVERTEGQLPTYRAIEWQPAEISFVTVPADAGSSTRQSPESAQGFPCVFTRAPAPTNQEIDMPTTAPSPATAERAADAAPAATTPTPAAPATPPNPAAQGDTQRAADITEIAQRHGMGDQAVAWIRGGHTVDQVRAQVLERLAASDQAAGGHLNRVDAVHDEADRLRAAGSDAILARAMVVNPATQQRYRAANDNPYRGMTLLEMARASVERLGVRTAGLSKLDLVGRAFTQSGSDFPVLLENAMHRTLQAAYAVAPDTWSRFCARGSVSDFRAHPRYRVGSLGNLDGLTELGEFRNKAIPDGEKASITAGTKGNIINLSRQAIINDDLGAFIGLAAMLARAAKRTVEADVYAYLASNPVLGSGFALFSAQHSNLEAAGAPTVETVNAARMKLAAQRDVGAQDFLDLRPAVWLGPLTYGGTARVINAAEYDPDTANKLHRPNMVRGLFRDIVDSPRIADTKWYLFADPADAPVIEVAFLDGQEEPFLDMEEGFNVDGARWKVRLDFGIAAIDFRGAVRNG